MTPPPALALLADERVAPPRRVTVKPAPLARLPERAAGWERTASDEQLARFAGRGAERAFMELHERHDAALHRYCLGMLRHREDAADVVQDTWMRAYAQLRDPKTRVLSIRAWLYAIARNACMDRLRARRNDTALDDVAEQMPSASGTVDAAERQAEVRALLEDLGRLSEAQRSAIVLREVVGLGHDEIAGVLDTTPDRARWLVADSRAALHELRDGRAMSCDEARTRIATRRTRDRAVRAHVAACASCEAHDHSRRARLLHTRCMAPVFAVWQGLRSAATLPRDLLGMLAGSGDAPAVAAKGALATLALTVAVGAPVVHQHHDAKPAKPAASAPASQRTAAAPAATATARPTPSVAAARSATPARHRRAGRAERPERAAQTPSRPAGSAGATPAPSPAPAATPAAPAATPAPPAAATPAPRPTAVEQAVEPVRRVVTEVRRRVVAPVAATVDRLLPKQGTTPPLVDATVQTVRGTLDALAGNHR